MGYYINPPQILPEIGRRLDITVSYNHLIDELQDDELLFIHLDRGMFQNAAYLFRREEFEEFEEFSSQIDGLVFLGYYAVNKDVAAKHGIGDNAPEQERPNMRNIVSKVTGNTLTITVDLSKDFGKTKSGRAITVASTDGWAPVKADDKGRIISFNLNCCKK